MKLEGEHCSTAEQEGPMPYPVKHWRGILSRWSGVIQVEIWPGLQRNHCFKQEAISKCACWLSSQNDLALPSSDPARGQGLNPCQCQQSCGGQ